MTAPVALEDAGASASPLSVARGASLPASAVKSVQWRAGVRGRASSPLASAARRGSVRQRSPVGGSASVTFTSDVVAAARATSASAARAEAAAEFRQRVEQASATAAPLFSGASSFLHGAVSVVSHGTVLAFGTSVAPLDADKSHLPFERSLRPFLPTESPPLPLSPRRPAREPAAAASAVPLVPAATVARREVGGAAGGGGGSGAAAETAAPAARGAAATAFRSPALVAPHIFTPVLTIPPPIPGNGGASGGAPVPAMQVSAAPGRGGLSAAEAAMYVERALREKREKRMQLAGAS